MFVITEGPWQYTYAVEDETVRYRWRVFRTPGSALSQPGALFASRSPESSLVLAEGTALAKEAAEHRAVQELTRIVAEARRSA